MNFVWWAFLALFAIVFAGRVIIGRRKIEPAPQDPIYLQTEAGVGYRFLPPQPEVQPPVSPSDGVARFAQLAGSVMAPSGSGMMGN